VTPTCVIYNPAAGRGRAERRLAEIRRRVPPDTRFLPTERAGHAVELAAAAVRDGVRRVVAAGGDGTVHEVANGVLAADDPAVRLAVLPVGSMNDYAFTLGLTAWWDDGRGWDELVPMPVDVGRLRAGGRERFFVNGCGVGFNGLVSAEARRIRWLRGLPLYSLAVLKALARHFAAPTVELTLDGESRTAPTLALSLGLGQREGGFPLTPHARLDDGAFDLLHVGDIGRWELVRHFPGMLTGRLPADHPELRFGRCRSAAVRAAGPLCVHADGELACVPADGVREAAVEVLPGRLTVEAYPPGLYGGRRFARPRGTGNENAGPRGPA
jgi:diacylglycerol kinase family enzyme